MFSPFPKIVNLDFTTIEIYEDYLVSTVKEGVVFDIPQLKKLHFIFDTYFSDKLFGFIVNKKNDYSVNPICYSKHANCPRLIGEAIFCHSESTYKVSQIEKVFYKNPFEAFFSLEECKNWINSLRKN
jgi:hypothetical protein